MKLPYKIRGSGGVAIIVAVMMVTVVSGIAVKYSWQSELNVTRAGHRWISLQAQAYSHGAEQLAILTLKQDKEETTADSLEEIWAQGIEFPTDHGSMHMKLTDMQARFNLNSLKPPFRTQTQVTNSRNTVRRSHPKYHPEHLRFLRLLQTIPLDEEGTVLAEEEAAIILDAVKDWVDADDTIEGFGGAERDYYEQLEPPVTITNGDMISITELRFIKDLPIQIYQGLLPYVTTLPDTSELNVNTMGPWLMRTLNLEYYEYTVSYSNSANR